MGSWNSSGNSKQGAMTRISSSAISKRFSKSGKGTRNTASTDETRSSDLKRKRNGHGFWLFAWMAVALNICSFAHAEQPLRNWQLEDSIRLRYFSGTQSDTASWSGPGINRFVVWSPNRKFFYCITHRGNLENDSNIYELLVFSGASIQHAFKKKRGYPSLASPIANIRMETWSSQPAIDFPQWTSDSDGITFRGVTKGGTAQVFKLNIPAGKLTQLTDGTNSVFQYTYQNGALLYRTVADSPRIVAYPFRAYRRAESGYPMADVWREQRPAKLYQTFVSIAGQPARRLTGEYEFRPQWIAPNGHLAVALKTKGRTQEFVLIDLLRAETRALPHSEVGRMRVSPGDNVTFFPEPQAYWFSGGAHLILVNVIRGAENPSLISGKIVDFDVSRSSSRVVTDLATSAHEFVTRVQANSFRDDLVLIQKNSQGRETRSLHSLRGNGWQVGCPTEMESLEQAAGRLHESTDGGLSIVLQQGANSSPTLVARYNGRELVLLEKDPALAGIWMAQTERFEWKDEFQQTQVGGLMVPRTRNRRRLPLVIQISPHLPGYFLPDGFTSSGYAAQTLVSSGFVVLNIARIAEEERLGNEGERFVKRIDTAVSALERTGLIDPARVGILGFSRNGYQIHYALTHPGKTKFAAAACVDSFTGSYLAYLVDAATSGDPVYLRGDYEAMPGGSFWDRKQEWLRTETTFNADKIGTPTLFTMHGTNRNVPEFLSLDVIGALGMNRKPFEFLYFPDGAHQLARPRERFAEMQAIVEWMRFWITDQQPSDPERVERWKSIRSANPLN